jgi:phospholipase C
MYKTYQAITQSAAWDKTVFIINYDEWGGFYDHVSPPATRDVHESTELKKNWGQRGFRTPTLLISPFARRGHISHRVYDHTSILKMIEWRWGLKPLTVRDAAARNMARELNFANPDSSVPDFNVPAAPAGQPCSDSLPLGEESAENEWGQLRRKAKADGWSL